MKITVASYKGGVGKTTTAVHLATYFQRERGSRVLLIDGDLNQSTIEWARTWQMMLPVVTPEQAREDMWRSSYHYTIIDTAARPEADELKSLVSGSDLLIIPTTPDVLSVRTLRALLRDISPFARDYRILITMAPPQREGDGEAMWGTLDKGGVKLFRPIVRQYKVYSAAAQQGMTVAEMRGKYAQRAWQDYVAVGQEVERLGGQ